MNNRKDLMAEIEANTDDEVVAGIVNEFLDEIEGHVNTIANTLAGIDIDTLDAVCEMKDLAADIGESLY